MAAKTSRMAQRPASSAPSTRLWRERALSRTPLHDRLLLRLHEIEPQAGQGDQGIRHLDARPAHLLTRLAAAGEIVPGQEAPASLHLGWALFLLGWGCLAYAAVVLGIR